MPQIVSPFGPRTIGEKPLYFIDFALNLNQGESIVAATWTCAPKPGFTDANAAARVSGPAAFTGSVTSQLVDFSNGPGPVVSGTQYILSATVTTSAGEILTGYGTVPGVFAES